MEFFYSLVPTSEHFRAMVYLIVFSVSFLESLAFVGLVIPGSTVIVFVGFLASLNYVVFGVLVWVAVMGAVLGDCLSFYFGRQGTGLFQENNRIFKMSYLRKGEAFFKKHGDKSVVLARFLGPIRPIIPFVAGLSKMNLGEFVALNVTSAILWAVSYLLVGFFFGGMFDFAQKWLTEMQI